MKELEVGVALLRIHEHAQIMKHVVSNRRSYPSEFPLRWTLERLLEEITLLQLTMERVDDENTSGSVLG